MDTADSPAMQGSAFFMRYKKPYLTIPEQIALLEERGMLVADQGKAAEYLRRIGYYRLSAYWFPFRERKNTLGGSQQIDNKFKEGTEFKNITDLYAFDKTLRLIVLDAIERIEVSIRTEVALVVGAHGPYAHREPKFLDGKFTTRGPGESQSRYEKWLGMLDSRVATSKEEYASHFRSKYAGSQMPIWIAVELLDFGPLSHFLSGMKYSDLQKISKSYGSIPQHLIKSWIRSLCGVRNVCAHHSRLWNRPLVHQPTLPKAGQILELDHITETTTLNRRLYAALAIMRLLLLQVNPRTKWARRLSDHIRTFPASPHINIASVGFPENWRKLPLWNPIE